MLRFYAVNIEVEELQLKLLGTSIEELALLQAILSSDLGKLLKLGPASLKERSLQGIQRKLERHCKTTSDVGAWKSYWPSAGKSVELVMSTRARWTCKERKRHLERRQTGRAQLLCWLGVLSVNKFK